MTSTLVGRLGWILLLFSCFAASQESSLTYLRADPAIVERRLTPVPSTQHDRIGRLRKQCLEAKVYGPVEVTEQNLSGQSEPNLICTLPGTLPSTIIVAVNTAYNATGDEGEVNWATLEMLPLLVESLTASPTRNTLQFVAFNGGKGRRSGAAFYLAHVNKDDRKKINAVIELDHLGRMPAAYAPRPGGYALGKQLRMVAWRMRYQIPQVYLDEKTGDTAGSGPIAHDFESARIRAITIYSNNHSDLLELTSNGMPTYVQKVSLDPKAYYETYLLLCAYLRQIDRDLGH
jgi:hypothetical protein